MIRNQTSAFRHAEETPHETPWKFALLLPSASRCLQDLKDFQRILEGEKCQKEALHAFFRVQVEIWSSRLLDGCWHSRWGYLHQRPLDITILLACTLSSGVVYITCSLSLSQHGFRMPLDVSNSLFGRLQASHVVSETMPNLAVHHACRANSSWSNSLTNLTSEFGASSWGDKSKAPLSGLIPGHAYTLISAHEVNGVRLLKLRNPWGDHEWTGDWSDQSHLTWIS